jgi:hypothetical protein
MEKINSTNQERDTVLVSPFFPIPPISKIRQQKKFGGPHFSGGVVPREEIMYEETRMSNSFVSIHWC